MVTTFGIISFLTLSTWMLFLLMIPRKPKRANEAKLLVVVLEEVPVVEPVVGDEDVVGDEVGAVELLEDGKRLEIRVPQRSSPIETLEHLDTFCM